MQEINISDRDSIALMIETFEGLQCSINEFDWKLMKTHPHKHDDIFLALNYNILKLIKRSYNRKQTMILSLIELEVSV